MKADKTSTLALVVAAIVLLVVGAMSYNDYLKAKYEKEFAGRTPAAEEPAAPAPAQSPPASTPVATPAPAPPGAAMPDSQNPAAPPPVPAPATAPSPGPVPAGNPNALAQNPAVPAPAAPITDPKMRELEANLAALRQENALIQQQLEKSRNGGGAASTQVPPETPASTPAPAFAPPPAPSLPRSAVAAAGGNNTPLTGPAVASGPASPNPTDQPSAQEVEQEINAMAEQVRKASAIARVIEYDSAWAFVIISAGRNSNVVEETRFAVRRGSEIVGWIKVTEVNNTTSVAELMSGNKFSSTAKKPQRGDDIIVFNILPAGPGEGAEPVDGGGLGLR